MAVLDRPTPDQIDQSVLKILDSGTAVAFPQLEERVKEIHPGLANRIQVRQSAWRLVRNRQATVTRDMKVQRLS